MSDNIYYVYQYYDPILKEPIYIGKGFRYRSKTHLNRKDDHPLTKRIKEIRKLGKQPIISIIKNNLSEKQALKLEGQLERKIGRKNIGKGPLLNKIPCGYQGTSGYKWSKEQKQKRCGSGNPMFGKHISEKHKEILKQRCGKNSATYGKSHSKETKIKISKIILGKYSKGEIKKRTKEWIVIFPNGKQKQIINLKKFCKKYNLSNQHMWGYCK